MNIFFKYITAPTQLDNTHLNDLVKNVDDYILFEDELKKSILSNDANASAMFNILANMNTLPNPETFKQIIDLSKQIKAMSVNTPAKKAYVVDLLINMSRRYLFSSEDIKFDTNSFLAAVDAVISADGFTEPAADTDSAHLLDNEGI